MLMILLKGGMFNSLICLLCLVWASKVAMFTICFKLVTLMAASPSSIPTMSWLGMTAENHSSGDILLLPNWKKEDGAGKENCRDRQRKCEGEAQKWNVNLTPWRVYDHINSEIRGD